MDSSKEEDISVSDPSKEIGGGQQDDSVSREPTHEEKIVGDGDEHEDPSGENGKTNESGVIGNDENTLDTK